MTLPFHAPLAVNFLPTHGRHHLMKFAGQAFFFAQSGKVANVVDEHPAVDGHRSTNRSVGFEGANDG